MSELVYKYTCGFGASGESLQNRHRNRKSASLLWESQIRQLTHNWTAWEFSFLNLTTGFSVFLFSITGTYSLKLNTIDVPAHRVVGDKATLVCQFDMEGDTLYSVKWYKDDREFYRYVPNDRPRLQVFDTKGIHVDVSTYYKITVFENHRKSLIQHCQRSELRLHFEWTKVN